IADCTEAIRRRPASPSAFTCRGQAYYHRKNLDRALADFNEAVRLAPQDPAAYHGRAYVFVGRGEHAKAVGDCREVIRLDAKDALARNNLAWLLATCPREEVRHGAEAVEQGRAACELTGWKDPNYLATLVAAYAEAGQFEEAVRWHAKALESPEFVRQYPAA